MELVSGFAALLQGLSVTMTTPTFASLTTVLTGWVFARRRTVTRMILAVGDAAGNVPAMIHPQKPRKVAMTRETNCRGRVSSQNSPVPTSVRYLCNCPVIFNHG